ncbi:cGMP-specific 3',5'-cyclic phosphodiesterase [Cricetulus griseus]|uniref:Phosphodiesterase n=1 Tax=Cricetulus griseus TaxID=10029 RepID=G3I8X7_CRIGR|nr:cGMP-specific 3',5'-cyclic phosphodiesterase [Cricetulus griseus]
MVNAWFSERVHNIPICKEGIRAHTESCSCSSQQSPHADNTTPGAPARKISASEFDRPLRPIVVKDSEGTVSFLSDSGKKEQMPLTPRRFDSDEGDQCSRLLELVKDISSHLDVTALCHKIFLHIHGLISADRYSLFLVCEDSSKDKFLVSRLFDVAEGSTLEEASNNCIRLEWNKGIVGHVAAFGEPLNIKDAYEDPRFNAEVDQITGYRTQSILCMPIKNHREEVVGVAQAINKKSGNGGTFTEKDEKDFAAYLAFCGIVLHNAQLYETSLLENKRNQVLLDLASLIFEEQQSLEVILKKIAATIISFMQVQKCTIFIVDEDCSVRVCQLVNKMEENTGKIKPFNQNDEQFLEAFVIFCGLGIQNTQMYEAVERAMAKQMVTLEAAVVPSAQTLKITDFSFSDFELSDVETALCTIRMFTDLNLVQNFQMKHEVLCRWILSVKKNYRKNVAYHNWRHAFNTAQCMFAALKAGKIQNKLTDLETLALLIAALSHDLDHRGVNNSYIQRAMLMTACDLSAITKPWPVQQRIAELVAAEFFDQGDRERKELNIEPAALTHVSEDCLPLLDGCKKNRQKWQALAEQQEKTLINGESSQTK